MELLQEPISIPPLMLPILSILPIPPAAVEVEGVAAEAMDMDMGMDIDMEDGDMSMLQLFSLRDCHKAVVGTLFWQ